MRRPVLAGHSAVAGPASRKATPPDDVAPLGSDPHFLLMTATPHNGKEEDFQLFLALLDGDRFEGRFRDGVHVADVSDPMRRMVKERLLKFDGKPLFPEGGAVVGALARPRTSRGAGDPGGGPAATASRARASSGPSEPCPSTMDS